MAAQISGSVGLAGSANLGSHGAMFEAIHGSAPKRAGQNIANPSGLLLSSVFMLNYLGMPSIAERIHNAWLKTLEEGIHTYDIFQEGKSFLKVGTLEFAHAVAKYLGQTPSTLPAVSYASVQKIFSFPLHTTIHCQRELMGVDVFIYARQEAADFLKRIHSFASSLRLGFVANRGVRIWPEGHPETSCSEQWRCRFLHVEKGYSIHPKQIVQLLQGLFDDGYDVIKTENLYRMDGHLCYSSSEE